MRSLLSQFLCTCEYASLLGAFAHSHVVNIGHGHQQPLLRCIQKMQPALYWSELLMVRLSLQIAGRSSLSCS